MRHYGGLKEGEERDETANDASWEAGRGAVAGALKWGLYTGAFGAAAYAFSPVYRGLTIQFKFIIVTIWNDIRVRQKLTMGDRYIQMSGMILGGWTEADRRMRDCEAAARVRRRRRIDQAQWEAYDREFDEEQRRKLEK